jgi:hypothetical protein
MVQPASVYDIDLPRQRIDGSEVWLPLYYHDNDTFAAMFTATYDAMAEVLPSPALLPVRWVDGRALLLVTALRYHETTWSAPDGAHGRLVPYAEINVCALVTLGKAPRIRPLFADHPRAFVLDLAVTERTARDIGRDIGFPSFLADMAFSDSPSRRSVRLSEAGQHILTLSVVPGGRVRRRDQSVAFYSALNGQLRETIFQGMSLVQPRLRAKGGHLELGHHEVAERLQALGVAPSPVTTISYLEHRLVAPGPGRSLGPAQDHPSYQGGDATPGHYTVAYPGTPPLDQYAKA